MWRFGDYYTGDVLKLNMETGKGFLLNPPTALKWAMARARPSASTSSIPTKPMSSTAPTVPAKVEPRLVSEVEHPEPRHGPRRGHGQQDHHLFQGRAYPGHARHLVFVVRRAPLGWLAPTPGFASKNGFELTVPYYLNIAPNRDLTLYPKYIQRRGIQLGAIGRYMGETDAGLYSGETSFEFLPNDKQTKTNRYMIKSKHEQALAGLDLRLGCARRIGQ
jgi:LPS-assembly protein